MFQVCEWLEPMGISQYALVKAIEVPPRRINEIIKHGRAITADTAVQLGAFFGPQSWMNLQTHYDTEMTKERIGVEKIAAIQQHATSV
ncbi:addiction module HigA family antidote [Mycetohabitans endofungorum]|uniref:Addiction module HigA family antidote n=3 Tax=Burkholderiaceae TaxID=119060 RepID=A0A2P5KAZ8_9BURK|nr:addiction module HigA family antidote [Mycetohabitans endofungorum]